MYMLEKELLHVYKKRMFEEDADIYLSELACTILITH